MPLWALRTVWLLLWLLPTTCSCACQDGGRSLPSRAESLCASQPSRSSQLIAAGHQCPRQMHRLRETYPEHWGIQRLSSSSLLEVPSTFRSRSSLAEPLGKSCNANSRRCQVGIVLERNNSCAHLRHLSCCWRQLTHAAGSYGNPVIALPFYNLAPSGSWHRQSLNQKAICSTC